MLEVNFIFEESSGFVPYFIGDGRIAGDLHSFQGGIDFDRIFLFDAGSMAKV